MVTDHRGHRRIAVPHWPDTPRREHKLEQVLIEHIQKFLLELGQGDQCRFL